MSRGIKIMYFSLIWVCIGAVSQRAFAQDSGAELNALLGAYYDYHRQRPREKVYLHTERGTYEGKERVWFSVYALAGRNHAISRISANVKVQLFYGKQTLIGQKEIPLVNGVGEGYFEIGKDKKPGEYRIVAFTDWLKNFGKDYYYQETFLLSNQAKSSPDQTASDNDQLTIHIPNKELIADMKQTVFLETNVNTTINLFSESAEKIATALPGNGWGSITFKPKANIRYYAQLESFTTKVYLPVVKKEGLLITVKPMGKQYHIIHLTNNSAGAKDRTYTGVILSRGKVSTRARIVMKNGIARAIIPNTELEDGISQVLLIDDKANPISQRLIYKTPEKSIMFSQQGERTGNKVKVSLGLTDKDQNPILGNFSISVRGNYDSLLSSSQDFTFLDSEITGGTPDSKPDLAQINAWLPTKEWKGPAWETLKVKQIIPTKQPVQAYIEETTVENQAYLEALDATVREVEGVVVTGEKRPEDEDDLKLVVGKGDVSLDFDAPHISDNESVLDVLQGGVAGMIVRGDGSQFPFDPPRIMIRGAGVGDPLIIMDQIIELTIMDLHQMRAAEVGSIEIFKGPTASARWGTRGAAGVIAIYSRKDAKRVKKPYVKKPILRTEEFELKKADPSGQGLLYWAPLLKSDEEGKLDFSFKIDPKSSGTIYLRIEGFTDTGLPVSEIIPLKVDQ